MLFHRLSSLAIEGSISAIIALTASPFADAKRVNIIDIQCEPESIFSVNPITLGSAIPEFDKGNR